MFLMADGGALSSAELLINVAAEIGGHFAMGVVELPNCCRRHATSPCNNVIKTGRRGGMAAHIADAEIACQHSAIFPIVPFWPARVPADTMQPRHHLDVGSGGYNLRVSLCGFPVARDIKAGIKSSVASARRI